MSLHSYLPWYNQGTEKMNTSKKENRLILFGLAFPKLILQHQFWIKIDFEMMWFMFELFIF